MFPARPSPPYLDLGLAVYLEDALRDKSVLFVGDAQAFPRRVAGVVSKVDFVAPKPRMRSRRRGPTVPRRGWPEPGEFWDVVVVADAALLRDSNISTAVDLHRVSRGGLVAVGLDTSDRQALASWRAALAAQYPSVEVIGQAEFQGFAIANLGAQSLEDVIVDDSARGEASAPVRIWLLATQDVSGSKLAGFSIVQVPTSRPSDERNQELERSLVSDAAGPNVAQAYQKAPTGHTAEHPNAIELRTVNERLVAEAEELRRRVATLLTERQAAERQAAERQAAERQAAERQAAEGQAAERQAAERQAAERQAAERQAAERQAADNQAGPSKEFEQEYGALERSLFERGKELSELRHEVARRERLIRELTDELKDRLDDSAFAGSPSSQQRTIEVSTNTGALAVVDYDRIAKELAHQIQQNQRDIEQQASGGQQPPSPPQTSANEMALRTEVITLSGRIAALQLEIREVRSRNGELDELREYAEGQVALLRDELTALRETNRQTSNALAVAEDRIAIADMSRPDSEQSVQLERRHWQAARASEEYRGEVQGIRMRFLEMEKSFRIRSAAAKPGGDTERVAGLLRTIAQLQSDCARLTTDVDALMHSDQREGPKLAREVERVRHTLSSEIETVRKMADATERELYSRLVRAESDRDAAKHLLDRLRSSFADELEAMGGPRPGDPQRDAVDFRATSTGEFATDSGSSPALMLADERVRRAEDSELRIKARLAEAGAHLVGIQRSLAADDLRELEQRIERLMLLLQDA